MNRIRTLSTILALVTLLAACAPRTAKENLDRGPTAPPMVVDAGRGEVFTEAFRLLAIAPGVEGFEADVKRGLLGNVTERKVCGNSGGWTLEQSDQGGGFISATSDSACEHYNALGRPTGSSTTSYRISIAIAGTVTDRSEVVVSANSSRAFLAAAFVMDGLLTKFGGELESE